MFCCLPLYKYIFFGVLTRLGGMSDGDKKRVSSADVGGRWSSLGFTIRLMPACNFLRLFCGQAGCLFYFSCAHVFGSLLGIDGCTAFDVTKILVRVGAMGSTFLNLFSGYRGGCSTAWYMINGGSGGLVGIYGTYSQPGASFTGNGRFRFAIGLFA